jgi:hypothetical protein
MTSHQALSSAFKLALQTNQVSDCFILRHFTDLSHLQIYALLVSTDIRFDRFLTSLLQMATVKVCRNAPILVQNPDGVVIGTFSRCEAMVINGVKVSELYDF